MATNGDAPAVAIDEAELRKRLTPEQYHVTREKGTERAFTGKYYQNKEAGTYHCVVCNQALFASDTKFDSGTVLERPDNSYGMRRVEIVCSKCLSHLGHVFDDGPRDKTGLRYCMNSCSLDFAKKA